MLRAGLKPIRSVKSWVIIYAGFMAAIVFAEHGVAMSLPDRAAVSPVLISAERPAVSAEPLVRRSDI